MSEGALPSFTCNGQEFPEEPPRYEQLEFMSMPVGKEGKAATEQEDAVKMVLQHAQPSSFTSEL